MKVKNDSLVHRNMPVLIEESEKLLKYLKRLDYKELKSIWKCSDNLANLNFERIKGMDLYSNLTPSLIAFEGLQYQYMGANVFTREGFNYLESHLRILSGFYGILRPFDGVVPYRLEMQAKFLKWEYESAYEFWDRKIADQLFSNTDAILNLASKEYSDAITKYLPENIKFIDCIFGEIIDGQVKQKGTLAKMARGEMVRFMAENKVENIKGIKKFDRLGYRYREKLSSSREYVFIMEG